MAENFCIHNESERLHDIYNIQCKDELITPKESYTSEVHTVYSYVNTHVLCSCVWGQKWPVIKMIFSDNVKQRVTNGSMGCPKRLLLLDKSCRSHTLAADQQ